MKKADARARSAVAEANRRRAEEQGAHHCAMVRELVLAGGMKGVKMGDLAARLSFSETTVRKHLMRMRAAGVVERTHEGGQSCRWGPPGIFALFAGERERARQSTRERSAKRRRAQATAEAAEEWAEQPVLRVIVRACDAPRLRPAGPASVFLLGGLAA